MTTNDAFAKGLEGVVAARSGICWIDGDRGILSYRGYDIHELAETATFEEVVHLLWHGDLPDARQLSELRAALAAESKVPRSLVDAMRSWPRDLNPMTALRTAVSLLGHADPDAEAPPDDRVANLRKVIRLQAQIGVLVATFERLRRGQPLLEARADRGLSWNFLWMLNGKEPTEVAERTMDICLVLHADHELNASTFSARVTAATLADMHGAVTSAVGTLKGPLHGGANTAVMNMLKEIGSEDRVEPFVNAIFEAKKKISGFGHRVYRTEDPRATHLRKMSKELGESSGQAMWYRMSERIEKLVLDRKGLKPNVDFYSASVYYMLGIPPDLYTPIFAISRMSGWTAHLLEQYEDNRLIRPRAEYTGQAVGRKWVPVSGR